MLLTLWNYIIETLSNWSIKSYECFYFLEITPQSHIISVLIGFPVFVPNSSIYKLHEFYLEISPKKELNNYNKQYTLLIFEIPEVTFPKTTCLLSTVSKRLKVRLNLESHLLLSSLHMDKIPGPAWRKL